MHLPSWTTALFILSTIEHVSSEPHAILQDPVWAKQAALSYEATSRICDALGEGDCSTNVAPHIEHSRAKYCQAKLDELEPCMTDEFRKYGVEECRERLFAYDACSGYM